VRVELHCQSTASDGSFSPADVAARAKQEAVELFCLTDHDSLAGSAATEGALVGAGIEVLRGLELSAHEAGRTVHLLVYRPKGGGDVAGWASLEAHVESLAGSRRARMNQMLARLAARGIAVDMADVEREAAFAVMGRPHLARALVARGVVATTREAFDRWLGDRGPAQVTMTKVDVALALEWAGAAGARVSLAHPHTLGPPAAADLLRRFVPRGLGGLEAVYGTYSPRERREWLALAAAHRVVATAGSDFHGEASPTIARPGIELDASLAAPLCEWLEVG